MGMQRVGHDLVTEEQQQPVVKVCWASQMALVVKNPHASVGEIRDKFLGWKDPLEEGMATRCSILAWKKNSMDRGDWEATVHGVTKSQTCLSN